MRDHSSLAPCRHRKATPRWDRVVCESPKLHHSGHVSIDTCLRCPFVDVVDEREAVRDPVPRVSQGCGCGDIATVIDIATPPVQHPRQRRISLDEPIRHLTMHVWPTTHQDMWRWNLEQITARAELFNGRKVLGVVYDYKSHFPDEVLAESARLGIVWDDVVVRRNTTKLGEVKTWLLRLEKLSPETAAENEVVFACHAKGVRHDYGAVIPWASLMYEACLDNWWSVREHLESVVMTGAMKQGRDGWRWEYSGSFYWFRLAEIGRRNWRNIEGHYAGTETWPAVQCHTSEAGCLFASNCGNAYAGHAALYDRWARLKSCIIKPGAMSRGGRQTIHSGLSRLAVET